MLNTGSAPLCPWTIQHAMCHNGGPTTRMFFWFLAHSRYPHTHTSKCSQSQGSKRTLLRDAETVPACPRVHTTLYQWYLRSCRRHAVFLTSPRVEWPTKWPNCLFTTNMVFPKRLSSRNSGNQVSKIRFPMDNTSFCQKLIS